MSRTITTLARWESMNDFIQGTPANYTESFEHSGEIAKLDRAAVSADKRNAETAGGIAANDTSNANTEHAQLEPFFNQELHAQHGFTPEQANEMLTMGEAGNGGATAGFTGEAALQAARTRNASGFTKSLDEIARDRQKTAAATSEGVAGADVAGAKALNQEGAEGLGTLYGQDTSAQARAMGQQTADEEASVEAGKSGWYQNLLAGINTAANVTKAVKPGGF